MEIKTLKAILYTVLAATLFSCGNNSPISIDLKPYCNPDLLTGCGNCVVQTDVIIDGKRTSTRQIDSTSQKLKIPKIY